MSIQAARDELSSLCEFQREIHTVADVSEKIMSIFHRTFLKSTWYSSIPMKLKCTQDGGESVYHVNDSFHFLLYTYTRQFIPGIRVKPNQKDKIRIAWCHNLGTNQIVHAVFKEDDEPYHKWDNVWADIYFQFYQNNGAGKRENHNIGIGNVKCLEEWSDFLPPYFLNVEQPWFYSMDHSLAFPIFYRNSLTRAEHRYIFRNKISDLLRVQIYRNQKWRNIKPGLSLSKYVDFGPNSELPIPELWGRYAYVSEPEIKWHKCKENRSLYFKDVEICDSNDPKTYLSTSSIDLKCTKPCLAFFWVAENSDSTKFNNYSNYTTEIGDLYSGWDPIKTTTLKYGTTSRLDAMASDHFSIAEPRKHFPSAPCERGYHGYSFAWDSTSNDAEIGIVFDKMSAKLHCLISDNNIFNMSYSDARQEFLDLDELEELSDTQDDQSVPPPENTETSTATKNPNFILRSRLLVLRKLNINSSEGTYKFSVH